MSPAAAPGSDAVFAAPACPVAPERVSRGVLLAYAPPVAGLGVCLFFIQFYFLKFATDVLLIAPAATGLLFGLARVWDAVSDPLAGYWSDRTRTRWGRRRPWMVAALPLLALSFTLVWSPPAALSGGALLLWTGAALFAFYTAYTIYFVPHQSLGVEITTDHHDRSRVFGMRHAAWMLSMMGAFAVMGWVDGSDDPRTMAARVAPLVAIAAVVVLVVPPLWLRERPEYWGRAGESPYAAIRDVLRNRHARPLLGVWFVESLGGAVLGVLSPFVTEYVVGRPDLIAHVPAVFLAAAIVAIPVWVWLSRRFGKRSVWLVAMLGVAFSFGGTFFVEKGDLATLFGLLTIAGFCFGCGGAIGQSILADVIDFDEYTSGERKEGAYAAAFGFALKSGAGLTIMVTGVALQLSGFDPNAPQSETALLTLRGVFAAAPFFGFLTGALIFRSFAFNEREYREVRAELDRRAARRRIDGAG